MKKFIFSLDKQKNLCYNNNIENKQTTIFQKKEVSSMTKKTKREMYNEILAVTAVAENPEMVDFINHQIELLDNRKDAPKKPTEKQVQNEACRAEILVFLTDADKPMNITDIQNGVPSITGFSNQRISRLLSALVDADKLTKEYIKGRPYFTIKQ